MVKFTWHNEHVPTTLPVRQVYGVLFVPDGRILLRREKGVYQLTGGKPEKWESPDVVLKREVSEEINCQIDRVHYVGYQEVDDGEEKYAQLRFVALIKEIGPARADVDRPCWVYGRELVSVAHAKEYLSYGSIAEDLINDALKVALANNLISQQNLPDEVLNEEKLED